ncbi:GSCOCG00005643001-RA-CDS, partial [Cotesia congregata]
LSTASWILLVFITYTMCNLIYFGKFDFFYEQNVRFDVDQESTLCLTPQQFAEKLATILSEKRINGAANFNQSDEFVQDSQQEEQNIMIIRYWDSFSIFDSNFWIKLIVYLLFSGEY